MTLEQEIAEELKQRLVPEAPAEVVITLPLCPSVWDLYKAAKRGQRRPKTPEYEAWIKAAGWELVRQRPARMPGKVSLLIEVGEIGIKALADCTNRTKAPEDLLVSHGIIQGDDRRYVRRVTTEWAPIEGLRITIRSLA